VHGCLEADTAAIKFVTAIVQGNLPHVPALLEASLIPVEKTGGGIRPIAVGEAMVSACLPVCARWLPGCWDEPETLVTGCWCGWGSTDGFELWAGMTAEPGLVTLEGEMRSTRGLCRICWMRWPSGAQHSFCWPPGLTRLTVAFMSVAGQMPRSSPCVASGRPVGAAILRADHAGESSSSSRSRLGQ
jgi:hypothetical protein